MEAPILRYIALNPKIHGVARSCGFGFSIFNDPKVARSNTNVLLDNHFILYIAYNLLYPSRVWGVPE
jgi:hypothetical protein